MGKGQGGGRGKGGCEGCETVHAVACCLCLVLLGGPILVAVGASMLAAATRNDRARNIDMVQAAVDTWTDATAPTSWYRFQNLTMTAVLSAKDLLVGARMGVCANLSIPLRLSSQTMDIYSDESPRFQSVKQLRFIGEVNYNEFVTCKYQANIMQFSSNYSSILARLPVLASPVQDYFILLDKAKGSRSCPTRSDTCWGPNYKDCMYNCQNNFYGDFSCNNGRFECKLEDAYITNMAIKVSPSGDSGEYYVDPVKPGAGGGANVLPYGYQRDYSTANLTFNLSAGPIFQVANFHPARLDRTPPANFTITVRSASDPWLSYMQATEGSGYLGVPKRTLIASGVILIILGCLGCMFWCLAAFYTWRMMCSRSRPTQRPQGMGGYAWDLANRYGGSYAPALGIPVHATGPNGMPTAQPYYVPPPTGPYGGTNPAPGQPAQGYAYIPQPYPPPQYGTQPPQGAYAPYPPYPPASYPPQGGSVEMSQQNAYGGNPLMSYGYYPQQQGAPVQPPYQYPPYGQPTFPPQTTTTTTATDGATVPALPSPATATPVNRSSANGAAAGDGADTGPAATAPSATPAGTKQA